MYYKLINTKLHLLWLFRARNAVSLGRHSSVSPGIIQISLRPKILVKPTGPINQTLGKNHHRYVNSLRTKAVVAI